MTATDKKKAFGLTLARGAYANHLGTIVRVVDPAYLNNAGRRSKDCWDEREPMLEMRVGLEIVALAGTDQPHPRKGRVYTALVTELSPTKYQG